MSKEGSVVPSLLDDLREGLIAADHVLERASVPDEERTATLLALMAVYDFLKSAKLRSRALTKLSIALQDIDRGQSPTLFGRVVQNRPKDGAPLISLKASAAAAMQLLMDAGKRKSEAAAVVARKLGTAGFAKGAATVARWRDKFGGTSDEEGADIYNFALQEARASHTVPAQQAEYVMGGLKGLVGNLDKSPS